MDTNIKPDWSVHTSDPKKWMKEKLRRRPEYKGPGFYLTKTDTLLVIPRPLTPPTQENIWAVEQERGTMYSIHMWNTPFHQTIFSVIALAPNRLDER